MRFQSLWRETLAALAFNRQRSLLTIVSLAWGVTCFVILYSYGEGFGLALTTSFKAVGQDLILMFGGQTSSQAGGERSGHKIRLEESDVDAIRETVPLVAAISPEVLMRGTPVIRGYRSATMTIRGVLPPITRRFAICAHGHRPLACGGRRCAKERVAVLGAKAAEQALRRNPARKRKNYRRRHAVHRRPAFSKPKSRSRTTTRPITSASSSLTDTMSLLHDVKYPEDIVWTPGQPHVP